MKNHFPKLETCNPSSCLSGRVMRIDRIISSIFRKYISSFGLSNSQLSMLFVTAKKEKLSQVQLSQILFLEKSSVNRNIKRLLDTGLIEKVDNRKIELTIKGKELLEKIIPEWQKAMKEVNEILGEDGQNAFNIVYQKITN